MSSVISARTLRKDYGGKTALELSCDIEEGKIVGLIGKNGAGKTTFLKACVGLLKPSAGEIRVLGRDPWRQRAELGAEVSYIPDMAALDGWLKVRDLLEFMQDVHPRWNREKSRELCEKSGLPPEQRIRTLSRGMRVKLYLLVALCIDSKLMILDEPTLGLDIPFRRAFFGTLLADYVDGRRTILISTHEVDEVEDILEEVIIIDRGRLICQESAGELLSRFTLALLSQDGSANVAEKHGYIVGSLMGKPICLLDRRKLGDSCARDQAFEGRAPKLSEVFIGFVEGGLR